MIMHPDMEKTFQRRSQNMYMHHKQRARRDGREIDWSIAEFRQKMREAEVCAYCRCLLLPQSFSCDHAVPTSRGGSYSLWNLMACCLPCNEAKGALTAEEFAALMQCLVDFYPTARTNVLQRLRHGGRLYKLKG